MKKRMLLVLAVLLLAMPCAMAQSSVTIEEMASHNDLYAVLQTMDGISVSMEFYDAKGSVINSTRTWAWQTEKGNIQYANEYADGSIAIVGGDEAYGYGFETGRNQYYVNCFVDDSYERELAHLYQMFLLNLDGGESLLSVEQADGQVMLTTAENIIGTDYAKRSDIRSVLELDTDDQLITVHRLNAQTLLAEEVLEYVETGDGIRTLLFRFTVTPNSVYEMPEGFAAWKLLPTAQTLHIIENPGTPQAIDHVFECPADTSFNYYAPKNTALYADEACTQPVEFAQTDEQGALPDEITLYLGPKQPTLVGYWASVGSQDAMPYLDIRADGTMTAYHYDGSVLKEGSYTFDEANALFTFPSGEQWTLTQKLNDEEMYFSNDAVGDGFVPMGTPVLLFEREPQSDMDDGWLCYAQVDELP